MKKVMLAILLLAGCAADELVDVDDEVDPEPVGDEYELAELEDMLEVDDDMEVGTLEAPGLLRPGCTARGTLAGRDVWMHFTRPLAPCRPTANNAPGIDTHIVAELVRLIDSVPAGGRIDGNIFNLTNRGVAAALLRAQDERNVTVRISMNGKLRNADHAPKKQFLDKIVRRVYCGGAARKSCIGAADGSIAHTKLFVFSAAKAPDGTPYNKVSWFGSANQTRASGMKTFNNTVTIYGAGGLYDGFRNYLDDMFEERRHLDYFEGGRGLIAAGPADAYASPERDRDLVVRRLREITPDDNCNIRVMQSSIRNSRMAVVRKLVRMKEDGCRIRIVASTIESNALAALKDAGIEPRKRRVHDKVFIVHGKYGSAYRSRVYTGSHNLSGSANSKYDEILVKLAPETASNRPVYDAFVRHFDDAYDGAPAW